jgi:hypothetical protein
MKKYTLEEVLNEIHKLHSEYPPHKQTPEIKKLLNELYKIECELRGIQGGLNTMINTKKE